MRLLGRATPPSSARSPPSPRRTRPSPRRSKRVPPRSRSRRGFYPMRARGAPSRPSSSSRSPWRRDLPCRPPGRRPLLEQAPRLRDLVSVVHADLRSGPASSRSNFLSAASRLTSSIIADLFVRLCFVIPLALDGLFYCFSAFAFLKVKCKIDAMSYVLLVLQGVVWVAFKSIRLFI